MKDVNIYLAPLEGITGYIFRNAHHDFFPGVKGYMSPFLSPGPDQMLSPKELRDVLPENNKGIVLIPQVLTARAEDFVRSALQLQELGYREVNLNLGCPSGTVVAKKKGAGLLQTPERLERFLDEIFERCPLAVSIKTRTGFLDQSEFPDLLSLYNKFPVEKLYIHPRVRTDFYNNKPSMDSFAYAVENSRCPVCYNGDITTKNQIRRFLNDFPGQRELMIGRGFLSDPMLHEEGTGIDTAADKRRLEAFVKRLLEDYGDYMSGDTPVLYKMKEIWCFLAPRFSGYEPYLKKIKKAKRLSEYEIAVGNLFREQELLAADS